MKIPQETNLTATAINTNKLWWNKELLGTKYLTGDLSAIEGNLSHAISPNTPIKQPNKETIGELKGNISW